MCKKRFTAEFNGMLDPDYHWRDNLYYLLSLQVKNVLSFHNGCVNTIIWDEPGECLLSGSDDRHIAITRVFPSLSSQQNGVVFSQKLPANSNIFTAKFLPHSAHNKIVVGFKCGCVLFVQPEAPPESRIEVVYCHGYAVYDVLLMPDQPHCFLTVSHDQSVMCFDTRIPFGFRSNERSCSQRCAYPGYQPMSVGAGPYNSLDRLKFQFPVTAGDVHPLDGSRRIALGCADGFVRLFDLRRATKSSVSGAAQGISTEPVPFQVTRPVGLPAQLAERRAIRLDYGPAHITSVQFEPLYMGGTGRVCLQTGNIHKPHSVGLGGKRLLVSHMYAPVFLFDLTQLELSSEVSSQPVDWLPEPRNQESNVPTTVSHAADGMAEQGHLGRVTDPDVRSVLALFYWLERQRVQRQSSATVAAAGAAGGDEDSRSSDDEASVPPTSAPEVAHSNRTEGQSNESSLSPFELLTEEYVANVLANSPRARQLMAYRGRRSCRTVIKAAVFWGRDFILSGSECGHVIVWNRWSGEPVSAIVADRTVVNRIAPHPHLPMFACSGIDRTVKLIEPDPNIFDTDKDPSEKFSQLVREYSKEASMICEMNTTHMRESLRSGSVILERLARIRASLALRSFRRRSAQINRLTEPSNPEADDSADSTE